MSAIDGLTTVKPPQNYTLETYRDVEGLSARSIVNVFLKNPLRMSIGEYNRPHDLDDMTRCIKAVRNHPELKGCFPDLAKVSRTWEGVVNCWDKLDQCYDDEEDYFRPVDEIRPWNEFLQSIDDAVDPNRDCRNQEIVNKVKSILDSPVKWEPGTTEFNNGHLLRTISKFPKQDGFEFVNEIYEYARKSFVEFDIRLSSPSYSGGVGRATKDWFWPMKPDPTYKINGSDRWSLIVKRPNPEIQEAARTFLHDDKNWEFFSDGSSICKIDSSCFPLDDARAVFVKEIICCMKEESKSCQVLGLNSGIENKLYESDGQNHKNDFHRNCANAQCNEYSTIIVECFKGGPKGKETVENS